MEGTEYTIVCLFIDSEEIFGGPFQIKASPSDSIYSLKYLILEQNKLIQTFFLNSYLKLWMCTPPLNADDPDGLRKCAEINLPWSENFRPYPVCDEIQFMEISRSLDYYWKDPRELPSGHIHMLIQLVGPTRKALLQGLNDAQLMSEKIKTLSLRVLQSALPSETINSKQSISQAYKETSGYVLRGRPAHNIGPSTSLFNPPLARLKDRIDTLNEIIPSPNVLRLASDFIMLMTAVDDDLYRPSSLISILSEVFPLPHAWPSSTFTCTVDRYGRKIGYIYGVFKDEKGLGGDATLQAGSQYSRDVAELRLENSSRQSNYPAILIGVMGTLLEISTVISLDGTCIDRLLAIDVLQRDDEVSILQLGRLFSILTEATLDLKDYHTECSEVLSSENPLAHFYPRPTPRPSDEYFPDLVFWSKINQDCQFTGVHKEVSYLEKQITLYFATLKNPKSPDLLSAAAPTGGVDVVVKFTKSYNEMAHRILADEGLAPPLYHCSQIAGGLYMILMKRIFGAPASNYQRGRSLPIRFYNDVERSAKLLHEANIVHGDLRPTNFLSTSEGGHGTRMVVIDFDWAGVAGKDRYPSSLNDRYASSSSSEERWAPGVGRYTVMMPEHDDWQLQRFKDSYRWFNPNVRKEPKPWCVPPLV